ncbi:MAG: hypothetical protein AAGC58_03635 [Asticcacaulis sp.]
MGTTSGNPVLKGFIDYIGTHLGQALGAIAFTATITFVTLSMGQKTTPPDVIRNPPPVTVPTQQAPIAPPIHLRVTATQQSAQNMAVAITESLTAELQRQVKASQARIELNIDNVRSGAGATKLATISWSIDLKGATPVKCHANGISFLKEAELSQKIFTRIISSLDEIETGRGTTCS